jgi:PleD family two-component response regulator
VSVLTVRLGLTPDAPAVVQHIARQIRSHLRSVDLVGVLGDRDIAVLLQDADKPHSMAVAERVQRLVAIETSAAATLGVATWNPGDALPVALVQQAREQVNHRYVV